MNLCRLRPGKWNKKSQELDSKFGHFSTESFVASIPDTDKGTLTAVIGNLEGLAFLGETQTWVKHKCVVLDGPARNKVYTKGIFKALIFAEFADVFDEIWPSLCSDLPV